jgi:hypothetical protein
MKRNPKGGRGKVEKQEGKKKHLLISPTYIGPKGLLQKTSSEKQMTT